MLYGTPSNEAGDGKATENADEDEEGGLTKRQFARQPIDRHAPFLRFFVLLNDRNSCPAKTSQ